jgi:methyl-accepting chemotaxis protein
MKNISKAIANGDLTISFDDGRNIESVYGAMKTMANNLLIVVSKIIDNSNNLASSAEETSALSLQSSVSLAQQQSSIEQVATAVVQMSASIEQVSNNATNAATSAQSAQQTSSEANDQITKTISDLGRLDKEMSRASQVIRTLENDSHEIGSVLESYSWYCRPN